MSAYAPPPKMTFPSKNPAAMGEKYWGSSEVDMRVLMSVPFLPNSPRLARIHPSQVPAAAPRYEAPPPRLPAPLPRPPEMQALQALETWLRNEIAPMPAATPHRLLAFRHAFNEVIAQLPAHGPMLAEIKKEYEWALDMAANGGPSAARPDPPPLRPLPPLHPLQMPAAYYEQQWRRCQNELNLVKSQRQRLRRMVKSLRGGAIEAVDRLQYAGGEKTQTPSSPGPGGMMSTASSQSWRGGGSGGGGAYPTIREDEEADDLFGDANDDDRGEADPEAAQAHAHSVVNHEMELEVEREVVNLYNMIEALESRVLRAGRITEMLSQSSLASRLQLEDELSKAAAEAEAAPKDEEVTRRASALSVLLKMLRTQEQQVSDAKKLLREPQAMESF